MTRLIHPIRFYTCPEGHNTSASFWGEGDELDEIGCFVCNKTATYTGQRWTVPGEDLREEL